MLNFKNKAFLTLCIGYTIAAISLFLFSYTQVDLSLTLSRSSIFQAIQKSFQHIGYYERPVATTWYVINVLAFFILFICSIQGAIKKKLNDQEVWVLIGLISILLVFSYSAFSYDIYNYMFTAKTVLIYHKNPYMVIPLQFTGVEPWLSFMRWTHLPSAYTPLWIVATLPFYFLGFGYFLLIFWNFKLFALICYVLTAVFLYKIASITHKDQKSLVLTLFALNPVIIFETLVSGHNDMFMMVFAMASMFFYLTRQKTLAYLLLAFSVAAKLMTIFLYPVIATGYKRIFALGAMVVGLVLVLFQREVLPWYMVWIIPYVALVPEYPSLTIIGGASSIGLLLRYAPFFYYGDYNKPVPQIEFWVTVIPIFLSIAYVGARHTWMVSKRIK